MTGDGSDTTLTLSINPVNENNSQVFIDGVYQNKSTYAISGTTLTFSAAPPNGSAVEVMTMTQTEVNVPVDGTITSAKLSGALTTPSDLTVTGALAANGGAVFNEASADLDFRVESNGNANMLFVDGGNDRVGIGGTGETPRGGSNTIAVFDVSASGKNYIEIQGATNSVDNAILFSDAATGNYGAVGYNHSTDSLNFYTSSAQRMLIDSSGNLLVGTTSGGARLRVTGAAGASASIVQVGTNGYPAISFNNTSGLQQGYIVTNASSVSLVSVSDQRLKENIADADDAGSKIDAIKVRQYDWKVNGSHQDYGMVAQELQIVAPEAVHQPADSEEMMGVDYSKLVPMLVKEIQSLRSRVAELENN
jgi:prepilin-type processing-associated H-X9-DG protein